MQNLMRENKRGWSIKGKDFIFGEKKKRSGEEEGTKKEEKIGV